MADLQTYIRTQVITQNQEIAPQDYFGYYAHNNGECVVSVDGVELAQGEHLDMSSLPYTAIYNTPIKIIFGSNSEDKRLVLKQIKLTAKL